MNKQYQEQHEDDESIRIVTTLCLEIAFILMAILTGSNFYETPWLHTILLPLLFFFGGIGILPMMCKLIEWIGE